jgi:RNA polymerase sigma-32 factor
MRGGFARKEESAMVKRMTDSDYSEGRSIDSADEYRPLVSIVEDEHLPTVGHTGLQRYLQEISQHKLLTREETEELAIRYRENQDPEAAYRLVTANLRLVVKVAMDFQKYWMQNFLDLIQEGNVGLVQAV